MGSLTSFLKGRLYEEFEEFHRKEVSWKRNVNKKLKEFLREKRAKLKRRSLTRKLRSILRKVLIEK